MVLFALREVALVPLWKQSIFETFLSSLYTRHCESIVENIFRYVAANCRKIASRVTYIHGIPVYYRSKYF